MCGVIDLCGVRVTVVTGTRQISVIALDSNCVIRVEPGCGNGSRSSTSIRCLFAVVFNVIASVSSEIRESIVVVVFHLFNFDRFVAVTGGSESSVGAGSPLEPLVGFILAAEFGQDFCVRSEQLGAVRKGRVGVELGNFELDERGIRLAKVEASTRHGDGEANLHGGRQCAAINRTPEFQGAVRATDAAFAVDHKR